jgi:hypothetical protein
LGALFRNTPSSVVLLVERSIYCWSLIVGSLAAVHDRGSCADRIHRLANIAAPIRYRRVLNRRKGYAVGAKVLLDLICRETTGGSALEVTSPLQCSQGIFFLWRRRWWREIDGIVSLRGLWRLGHGIVCRIRGGDRLLRGRVGRRRVVGCVTVCSGAVCLWIGRQRLHLGWRGSASGGRGAGDRRGARRQIGPVGRLGAIVARGQTCA